MTTQTEHPITRAELREELAHVLQHYATKADVAEVKAELKADIARLDLSIAEFKAAMAQMEVRLVRWGVGGIVAASAVVTVIVRFTG